MKRLLASATMGVALLVALPAAAGTLDGGCTVSASSDVDQTDVLDATRADPFEIDMRGGISWDANSPSAIRDHRWEVWVALAGAQVTVASGGDPNTAGSVSSQGSRSVEDLVDQARDRAPAAIVDEDLSGIYLVGGGITGEGGACSGDAYVRLVGNPLGNPVGQAGAAAVVVGLGLVLGAGVARKP